MNKKIVFLDIDGTILNKNQEIPASARTSIDTLQKNGTEVILSTGRNILKTLPIAQELGIDSIITNNGSYVSYKGKEIHKIVIPKPTATLFIEEINHKQCAGAIFGKDKEHYSNIHHPVFQEAYDVHHGTVNNIKNTDFNDIEEIYSMGIYTNNTDEIHYFEERFPNLSFVRWNTLGFCYDVLPKFSSKAEGIKALLAYLEWDKADAIAFGDGENDKEMLSYVGIGVAMGNSHPSLIPYANFQTTDVDEDGLWNGLKQIGLLN